MELPHVNKQAPVASEEQNRLFIEYAPAAMAMFNKEMAYISVSRRWMKEYDLAGNIVGKKHYELFPNILSRWKDVHARCMEGAIEKSEDDFYVKDNGTPVWLKWEVYPWYTPIGDIGGIVIFTENITERKEAEAVQSRLSAIVRQSADAIYSYNLQGTILSWNHAAEKLFGYSETEMLGKNIQQIIPPGESLELLMTTVKHGDSIQSMETTRKKKDGTDFPALITASPIYDKDNHVEAVSIILRDITERKQSERLIRESEERFRTIAGEAPMFVWETDEHLNTTYLNKEGLQYFNIGDVSPVTTLSWNSYIHPGDKERAGKIKLDAAKNSESYALEIQLRNGLTNEYRWFLDKGSPKYKEGKFAGFIGISLDIQNRKETQQQLEIKILERTKELKTKNEEFQESIHLLRNQELRDEQKNNFIAMASHELRTPVTSIKGYVQVLLSAYEKGKDENKALPSLLVRSSLISVDKQVTRLTRLIAELLDLSRIESGTLEMKKEKFSLNELAIDTIEDIRYTNASHEINLYNDFHGSVLADKDRIGQAMINFLTNAIKYSPGSKKVDVTIAQPTKGEIAYSVRDYGIGIDKTQHDKIFQRFYRAEGRKEQTYPGFGIGLFIVSEFIQKHGGRLQLESEKGKGSLFTFILPVCID
jgi:PAS domain S-box-containing protein